MAQTCLPDELWSDPRGQYLMKRKRRLWILLCDIHRLGSRYPVLLTQPNLPIGVWTVNLDLRSDKQLEKDIAQLRAMGVLAADALRIEFSPIEEGQAIVASASRPRYPSDERRKTQSNGHCAPTPQPAPAEPADTPQTTPQSTPQTLWTDSATEQTDTPQPSRARNTGTGTGESVFYIKTPESGTGTGTGAETSGGYDPCRDDLPTLRAEVALPAQTTLQRLIELGMSRAKAESRMAEFGEARCQDALDSLPYWAHQRKDPAATVVDFLVHHRPLPAALVKARERAAQQGMTMLAMSDSEPVSTANAQQSGVSELPTRCREVRPPPGVPPSPGVIEQTREALKRAGGGRP